MPNFTSLTINDGSATPAAVNYTPEAISTAKSVFVDKRLAPRAHEPQIVVDFSAASASRPDSYKIRRLYTTPIVVPVGGSDTIVGYHKTEIVHTISVRGDTQSRKHHIAMVSNGESTALFKTMSIDLEGLW